MFNVDNIKIGKYVSALIDEKYNSARDFCRDYLKKTGEAVNEDSIRRLANKVSQIKRGRKGLQIEDLPVFSDLLDVSIERILSGGECGEPKTDRMSNYSVAQSQNKDVWESYFKREDAPFLNPDEFGKTIIEYAIEYQNYGFIKFLIDEKYIWFDSGSDKDYILTFGAGTSIRRQPYTEDLQYKISTEDQLRQHIITMATENSDIEMLEKLKAREIPQYYNVHYLSCSPPDIDSTYDSKTVKRISESGKKVLEYFTETFEIRDMFQSQNEKRQPHTFMYPHISRLLDFMIANKSPYTKSALKKAIEHNRAVYKKLVELIKQAVQNGYREDSWKKEADFYENGNIVSFRDVFTGAGIITNIACTTRKPSDDETCELAEELNEWYFKIKNIKEENF